MPAEKRPTYAFSLDRKMVEEIDDRRGMIPRSRYVEFLLINALEGMPDDSHTAANCHE